MEEKIAKLEEKVTELSAKLKELQQKVEDLSNGSLGTGVYLEGVSDYNKEFIIAKKEGK